MKGSIEKEFLTEQLIPKSLAFQIISPHQKSNEPIPQVMQTNRMNILMPGDERDPKARCCLKWIKVSEKCFYANLLIHDTCFLIFAVLAFLLFKINKGWCDLCKGWWRDFVVDILINAMWICIIIVGLLIAMIIKRRKIKLTIRWVYVVFKMIIVCLFIIVCVGFFFAKKWNNSLQKEYEALVVLLIGFLFSVYQACGLFFILNEMNQLAMKLII